MEDTGLSDANPSPEPLSVDQLTSLIRDAVQLMGGTTITRLSLHTPQTHLDIEQQPAHTSAPVPSPQAKSAPAELIRAIKSPVAGVFYRSSAPGQPAFAEEGDDIEAGTQVAVIEVMKTYTPVLSTHPGRISAFLVRNNQVVEFDENLLTLEATHVTAVAAANGIE